MKHASAEGVPATSTREERRIAHGVAWLLPVSVMITFLALAWRKYRRADPAADRIVRSRRGWLWARLAGGATTWSSWRVPLLAYELGAGAMRSCS